MIVPHSAEGIKHAAAAQAWADCAATFARAQGAEAAVVLLTPLEEQPIQMGDETTETTTWTLSARITYGSRKAVADILELGGWEPQHVAAVRNHDGQGVVVVIGRASFEPLIVIVFPSTMAPAGDA